MTQRRNLAPHDTPPHDRFDDEVFLTGAARAHCGQEGRATRGARFLRCVVESLRSFDHFGRNDMMFFQATGKVPHKYKKQSRSLCKIHFSEAHQNKAVVSAKLGDCPKINKHSKTQLAHFESIPIKKDDDHALQ